MKLFPIITRPICIAGFFIGTALAQPEYSLNEVNARIDAIVARNGHLKETALALSARKDDADFQALRAQCQVHWARIFQNFDEIHHGVIGQELVVETLTELSASDFMSAFETLVTKLEAGNLDKQIIESAMGFFMGRLRGFFRDNYQHPRVIAALNKVKVKMIDDENIINRIDKILSGEAKRNLDIYREAHEGVLGEDIPKIILSNE